MDETAETLLVEYRFEGNRKCWTDRVAVESPHRQVSGTLFSQPTRRLLMILAAAVALGFFTREVQAAYPAVEVKLNGGTADFGDAAHSLGAPNSSGKIQFRFSLSNGQQLLTTARVTGKLYWDSLEAGCARLTIEFNRDNRTTLSRVINHCGPGGNANLSDNFIGVDEQLSDENLRSIVIKTHEVIGLRVLPRATSSLIQVPTFRSDNIKIENGNEDFGDGNHSFGAPSRGARVTLSNDNGIVKGTVSGTLYWDDLFKGGCAHMFIEYEDINGHSLNKKNLEKCGPGGNANEAPNQLVFIESYNSGQLFKIRIGVGGFVKAVTLSFEP